MTTSSITAVSLGILSSISRGKLCQSRSAIGPTSVDQFEDWYSSYANHRHGWRKLMPRPFHPKRNLAAQDAFKKTVFVML
jgi:hypothetical protein